MKIILGFLGSLIRLPVTLLTFAAMMGSGAAFSKRGMFIGLAHFILLVGSVLDLGISGLIFLFLPAMALFWGGLVFLAPLLVPIRTWADWPHAASSLIKYTLGINFPFYAYENGALRERAKGNVYNFLGAPGIILLDSHQAVVLHTGIQYTRVDGRGLVFTRPLERVLEVIDLRPQIRRGAVRATTRDGIPVEATVSVVYQVDDTGANRLPNELYPYTDEAVFRSVHNQGVGPEEAYQLEKWLVSRAEAVVHDAIASRMFDDLWPRNHPDINPIGEITRDARNRLETVLENSGIRLIGLGVGRPEIKEQTVVQQRIRSWQAEWRRRQVTRSAESEAEARKQVERARARAQMEMVTGLTEAFREAEEHSGPISSEAMALCLLNTMERMVDGEATPDTKQNLAQLRQAVVQGRVA